MSPHSVSVSQLSKETGVTDVTLYKWKRDYQNRGVAVPANNKKSEDWTAKDKLAVVIETASLNEIQLSEYCRTKGLYKEQIDQWKTAALSGYKNSSQMKKTQSQHRREDKQKIKNSRSHLEGRVCNKWLQVTRLVLGATKTNTREKIKNKW